MIDLDVRWLRVKRGSKGREFARPLSERGKSQRLAQGEFGKRGFRDRHGSEEIQVIFEFLPRDPVRHVTSDNPRGDDGDR